MKRELSILLVGWLVLAAGLFGVGRQNLSTPGLYYDEAIYGGLAKDFLAGQASGGHMPGVSTAPVFGRPLPIFVQPYLGALKCWLLIPVFKVFGATQAVLRGTNLFFTMVVVLIFMLWTWRLLGLAEALLAGLLLASDPSFIFPCIMDWGSLLPSLLCRLGGFFLALLAWRRQEARWALAAGFVFGLGFFNKIDFGVILAGTALAAGCAGRRAIATAFRIRPQIILLAVLGFLAGAGPVLAVFRVVLAAVFSQNAPHHPGELAEKWHTLRAMYDGSYFYRLMDAGGQFDKMYLLPSPGWPLFGMVVLLAALVLLADVVVSPPENPLRRTRIFILLSAGFVTLGALILPGAVRIHHTTMVYPFPHLLIAAAAVTVWRRAGQRGSFRRPMFGVVAALVALVVVGNFAAVQRTQQLVRETGGRGWWSNALEKFAQEIATRSDLTVASLDWGFNEQLEFLTRGPHLEEPFWQFAFGQNPGLPRNAHHLYLAHPAEFSLSPLGGQFMEQVARENTNAVIQSWRDEQGRVAFYSIAFPAP